MAPNLYICARNAVNPKYWFKKMDPYEFEEQYWEHPIPGIYKHYPGQGWHLMRRKGARHDEEHPPVLVYCRLLHRYMFEKDVEARCRWVVAPKSRGGRPEKLRFFLLDDGVYWVAAWDAKGRFIPGPYAKWYMDDDGETMIRGETPPGSRVASRANSIVG